MAIQKFDPSGVFCMAVHPDNPRQPKFQPSEISWQTTDNFRKQTPSIPAIYDLLDKINAGKRFDFISFFHKERFAIYLFIINE
jgi:hypothetical protein